MAGDAAIQIAVLDVAADFLRADQPDFQFLVIHVRNVGTAADRNVEAGLGHLFDGGILQTAFRQPELQNLFLLHAPSYLPFPALQNELFLCLTTCALRKCAMLFTLFAGNRTKTRH